MLFENEEFKPGQRVKHRMNGHEGTVKSICQQSRRRVEWDNDRITLTHTGDLMELVD